MLLKGVEFLQELVEQGGFSAKMILNAEVAIIFPTTQQHREQKAEGVSYEDNYRGNALTAMLSPGKAEIRHHESFSDQQVGAIIRSLLACPELSFIRQWRFTYQGRPVP